MQVHVKNMVCPRCIKSVTEIFQSAGASIKDVKLGVVTLDESLSEIQSGQIKTALVREGFEIIDDQRIKLTDQVKKLIIELVHFSELDEMKENLSDYLVHQLHKDYNYLSNLFSSVENTTIEQYFILQKIEKVKEWLVYNELTLSQMAFKLGYSSVAHLSNQFKKITGFTPSHFKKLKEHNRRKLDAI
jgi:YesN/AraC family two-component response regulator